VIVPALSLTFWHLTNSRRRASLHFHRAVMTADWHLAIVGFPTSAVSRFAPIAPCTTSISLMAAAGTALAIGVTPNGNGPAPHFALIFVTAAVMVRFSRPETSVTRHVSGVMDTSLPAAKSRAHLRTVCPWIFAIFPTAELKAVMQA
jgi:hypothetical protein